MRHLAAALALIWVVKWFGTAESLVTFLNTLPAQQQASAKVIVAPSSRNPLGWGGDPYGLIYEDARSR